MVEGVLLFVTVGVAAEELDNNRPVICECSYTVVRRQQTTM